jgi:hypothetical protein
MGIALEKIFSGYFQKAEEAHARVTDMRGRGGLTAPPPIPKTMCSEKTEKCNAMDNPLMV